eukprot:2376314-Pyramimonas_sp.AAC.1
MRLVAMASAILCALARKGDRTMMAHSWRLPPPCQHWPVGSPRRQRWLRWRRCRENQKMPPDFTRMSQNSLVPARCWSLRQGTRGG